MPDLSAQIEALLTEPLAAAAERERTAFAADLAGTDGSVVLFGAGRLGRLCARALQRLKVPLRAFCDRNPALQGMRVEGADVLDPEEAVRRFGARSLFVVAIWTGTARENMVERIAWLASLGCRQVVPYATLVWTGGATETPFHSFDLPTRVLADAAAIRRLAGRLADDESRRVLRAALQQRLWAKFENRPAEPCQYFPRGVVVLTGREIFVDGGAFDGDTLDFFLRQTDGRFCEYHAFEPDATNLGRLRQRVAALAPGWRERIQVHPMALYDSESELIFDSHGGQTSQVTAAGAGRVSGRPLDQVLAGRPITFIKLDVEGAERAALRGARRLIEEHEPSVAVCVYHGSTDLWEIPLQVREWLPRHRIFLRQHGFDGWEMVGYLVPSKNEGVGK